MEEKELKAEALLALNTDGIRIAREFVAKHIQDEPFATVRYVEELLIQKAKRIGFLTDEELADFLLNASEPLAFQLLLDVENLTPEQAASRLYGIRKSRPSMGMAGNPVDMPITLAEEEKLEYPCLHSRSLLALMSHYNSVSLAALRGMKHNPECESASNKIRLDAAGHLKTCSSCSNWVREICGSEVFARLIKLDAYCCNSMYGAVEEPRSLKVEFLGPTTRDSYTEEAMERWVNLDAPGDGMQWVISCEQHYFDKSNRFARLLLFYCPWCGEKLEHKPFVFSD